MDLLQYLPAWMTAPTLYVERGLFPSVQEDRLGFARWVEVDVDASLVDKLWSAGGGGALAISMEAARAHPEVLEGLRRRYAVLLCGEDDGVECRIVAAELGGDGFVGLKESPAVLAENMLRAMLHGYAPPMRVLVTGPEKEERLEELAAQLREGGMFHVDVCPVQDVLARAVAMNAELVVIVDGARMDALHRALESTSQLHGLVVSCKQTGAGYMAWRCGRDGRLGEALVGDMQRVCEAIVSAGRRGCNLNGLHAWSSGLRGVDIPECMTVLDGTTGGCAMIASMADGVSVMDKEAMQVLESAMPPGRTIVVGEGIVPGASITLHPKAEREAMERAIAEAVLSDGAPLRSRLIVGIGEFQRGNAVAGMNEARRKIIEQVVGGE